jgi:peptide-methionine (S)-S-oxide reductase
MKTIVIGGGCFWCVEAIYQRIKGVESVVSGYAGGDLTNPTYENHGTHAEVVQITYDESILPLKKIFEIFFYVHDPTTVNQQGNDRGTQYRSIILCNNYIETEVAHSVIKGTKDLWPNPIVTEVNLLKVFYKAEDYHQDYFNQNQNNPYCQVVINPKIAKFEQKFSDYLK